LYSAAGKGHVEVVKFLIQNHVDVNLERVGGRKEGMRREHSHFKIP